MRKRRSKPNTIINAILVILIIVLIVLFILFEIDKFNKDKSNSDKPKTTNNVSTTKNNTKDDNEKKDYDSDNKEETNQTNNKSNNEEPKKTEKDETKQEIQNNVTVNIELIGNDEITLNVGDKYNEQGAKAIDSNGKDVSKQIKIEGSVDTSKPGDYMIIYSIGKSMVIRNVTVK